MTFNRFQDAYITTEGDSGTLVKARVASYVIDYKNHGEMRISLELVDVQTINQAYLKDIEPEAYMALIEDCVEKESNQRKEEVILEHPEEFLPF